MNNYKSGYNSNLTMDQLDGVPTLSKKDADTLKNGEALLRKLRRSLTDNEETNAPIYANIKKLKRALTKCWRVRRMAVECRRKRSFTM
jgi:hypothetical protein